MNLAYLSAIGTLLCWTVSTFALARLTRLVDALTLNKAVLFFSTILLAGIICVFDNITPVQLFSLPTTGNWLWLSVSGILGKSLGDYCGYQAMRILGARRRTMITTLGPGFTWLFGFLILDETMNWLGIASMCLTLLALIFFINSNAEKREVKKENFGLPIPGFLFGISAAGLTGLAFILSKLTITETAQPISAFHATWIRIISAFVAVYAFDIFRKRKYAFIKPFVHDKQKGLLLFICILFGAILGLSLSLMSITRMNAAAAYTIFAMLPITVTLVSVMIYKKKISTKSIFYSLLAIMGVVVLVWRNELIQFFK